MPLLGKLALYTLTILGVASVTQTLIAGPPNGGWHKPPRPVAQSAYCGYTLFAESRDTTYWQVACLRPAHPWDTIYVPVRP